MSTSKEDLKVKFQTKYTDLSDFASDSRLLQSIWREENHIPINNDRVVKYTKDGEWYRKKKILGNYIDPVYAEESYCNFLTEKIAEMVRLELVLNKKREKKEKKVLKKDRLLENMLSSQPLAFNLFGELAFDLNFASIVFKSLFPDKIIKVKGIQFEISPGRGDMQYTGDYSAFDVFVEYKGNKGNGFIGIEVKYAEALLDNPASGREEYIRVARDSKIFTEENISKLYEMPKSIEQIWRDHLLALSILQHSDNQYQEGFFIYLYPKDNKRCEVSLKDYKRYMNYSADEENNFYPIQMENLVEEIKKHTSADWIDKFYDRYLNFDKINKYLNE